MKASTQPLISKLQPMPIPRRSWQFIEMNFLMPIPEFKNKQNVILVVVDCLTKMTYFILITDKVTAKETAELFLYNIFRYYGLPDNIVSDRDPQFISHF